MSLDEAVKIRCRHCSLRDVCTRREQKERYEEAGWMTHCTLTPDGKKKKKRRRKQK